MFHRHQQKIFQGGGNKNREVLTTKNGRIFWIWKVKERVCENPGGGTMAPLSPPPLADAHDTGMFVPNFEAMSCVTSVLGHENHLENESLV